MKLLIIFIILNIINVILQTVKSIATVKCGKLAAALVNAIAYGLYTIVLVYTNCELNLWAKVAVVASANLIGVYVVKYLEEKARKDKLWKIEATVKSEIVENMHEILEAGGISHNYLPTNDNHTIINCFCQTQEESKLVKKYLTECDAKYFVTETKIL